MFTVNQLLNILLISTAVGMLLIVGLCIIVYGRKGKREQRKKELGI